MAIDAYEPPPENGWVRPVIVGWAGFMGLFGAWGWMAAAGYTESGFASAGVSLFACVILLNASVQLRRAGAKKARRASTIWTLALILFGSWSGYSAHHAFEMTQGGPVSLTNLLSLDVLGSGFLLLFFLGAAWIDPLLMWAVEDTERAKEPEAEPEPVKPKGKANLRLMAGGLGGAAALALAPTAARSFEPVAHSPVTEPVNRQSARNREPDRAQAKMLLAQGLTAYSVNKATGVPISTLKRWAKAA